MSTAVVLGASSGVGYYIADELAKDRRVVGFHRGHYPAGAAYLSGVGVKMIEADCGTMYSDVDNAIEKLRLEVAPFTLGLVVHSISGASVGRMLATSPLDVEKTFNRLAHSFLWWAQRLQRTNLLARECTFVALSNPVPDFYLTNSGVIGAAKAALEAYVKHLGCELAHDNGMRAIGIRFSTVVTPALEKVMPQAIPGLHRLHAFIQPQGRMQTAGDVAQVVRAVTAPEAKWLNGTVIDATGGAPAMLMDYAFRSAERH